MVNSNINLMDTKVANKIVKKVCSGVAIARVEGVKIFLEIRLVLLTGANDGK